MDCSLDFYVLNEEYVRGIVITVTLSWRIGSSRGLGVVDQLHAATGWGNRIWVCGWLLGRLGV